MRVLTFCIRQTALIVLLVISSQQLQAQEETNHYDTIPGVVVDSMELPPIDTPVVVQLRIKNLNPYFTLHVDSTLSYKLEINKDQSKYYWYMRNSPIGLSINKDNGRLSFKADKNLFLSGKLRYDNEYRVQLGVQALDDPFDRVDTSFSILFYNTDIIVSRVKPTVSSTLTVDEGDTVAFKVQCENGNFPIENITFFANTPLKNFTLVKKCDDEFVWTPSFDFVKEAENQKERTVLLSFVGANRMGVRDTAIVKVVVKDALNYPFALQEYNIVVNNIDIYIRQLKYAFLQLDKRVKNTKTTRTTFDITSSSTALTGTILSSSDNSNTQKTGKILPSVGVSLVPVKEAVAPQKVADQNQASNIRGAIKRLDFMLKDNGIVGERDPDITKKTNKLKDELKQIQVQLIDIPIEISDNMTEDELNKYFNNPRVNKKYRVKGRK